MCRACGVSWWGCALAPADDTICDVFDGNRSLEDKEANWRANACRDECRDDTELAARQYCVSRLIVDKWRRAYMVEYGLVPPTAEEQAAQRESEANRETPY